MRRVDLSILVPTVIAAALLGAVPQARAQQTFTGAPITYDFATYAGAGLQPTPLPTQVDSDEFQVIGGTAATNQCLFGATCTTVATPMAGGPSSGGETAGRLFGFTVAPGDVAFGLQPTGSFFGSPAGNVWIRFTNGTGATLNSVRFSHELWVFNDAPRSSTVSVTFANGTDVTSMSTTVTSLITPLLATAPPTWASTPFSGVVDVSSLAIAPGASFYVVYTVVDESGTGARDEIAFDDVTIRTSCGDSVVDPGEACDAGALNGMTTCGCQARCVFGASGAACAPSTGGVCDLADTCDGAGACVNRFVAAGTTCRAAAAGALCDAAETCSGTAATCPADANLASGTPCRPAAAGGCDVAETCTGGPACPADAFRPTGFVCAAASAEPCDVDDVCSGTSVTCAPRVATAGTACRAASGACDVADVCNGTASSCTDGRATDGTPCADTLACNGAETCVAGACASMTPIACDDGDACTADACGEPAGTCVNDPIADCCNDAADCDDSDDCTIDACSGAGGTCTHAADPACADAGTADAGDLDAGTMTDGGGATDSGTMTDAGTPGDASAVDAGPRDASATTDGARVDTGVGADAGATPGTPAGGCACTAAGAGSDRGALLLALGLAFTIARRRRGRAY